MNKTYTPTTHSPAHLHVHAHWHTHILVRTHLFSYLHTHTLIHTLIFTPIHTHVHTPTHFLESKMWSRTRCRPSSVPPTGTHAFASLTPKPLPSIGHILLLFFPYQVCIFSVNVYICWESTKYTHGSWRDSLVVKSSGRELGNRKGKLRADGRHLL